MSSDSFSFKPDDVVFQTSKDLHGQVAYTAKVQVEWKGKTMTFTSTQKLGPGEEFVQEVALDKLKNAADLLSQIASKTDPNTLEYLRVTQGSDGPVVEKKKLGTDVKVKPMQTYFAKEGKTAAKQERLVRIQTAAAIVFPEMQKPRSILPVRAPLPDIHDPEKEQKQIEQKRKADDYQAQIEVLQVAIDEANERRLHDLVENTRKILKENSMLFPELESVASRFVGRQTHQELRLELQDLSKKESLTDIEKERVTCALLLDAVEIEPGNKIYFSDPQMRESLLDKLYDVQKEMLEKY